MKNTLLLCLLLLFSKILLAAQIVSGPIPYHVDHQTISFGLMLEKSDSISVTLIDPQSDYRETKKEFVKDHISYKGYTPLVFEYNNLKANYLYQIQVKVNNKKPRLLEKKISTKPLPGIQDFSFMLGSCAYTPPITLRWMHPGIEDRIYPYMTQKKTDFMLWLGDYLYFFKKHYSSFEGMMRKHVKKRNISKLNNFLMSRPQYAVWDDHDFGSDNCNRDFALKDDALKLWKMFWNNPGYGLDSVPGCFFNFSYQDCDFFMLDNRYYRTEENIPGGEMFGPGQLEWLKTELKNSDATFKFIIAGSQVFNDLTEDECYCDYPEERQALMDFINDEKIEGIVWISGDRHHSSLFKVEDIAAYPYYEYTCSAITTFRSKLKRTNEYINPIRLDGTLVQKQNFGIIRIEGPNSDRKCIIETYDNRGSLIWEYTIAANELK